MQAHLALSRSNISEDAAVEIRNMIVDGRLPAGERINEVHLSAQLGISRTPLREALARLAHEGAITSTPKIGYFVRPLSLEEFEQIYAIRPLLDPEALRLAGLPTRQQIDRLSELNDDMAKARNADAIISLDDEWHMELIQDCPNKVLLELIQVFINRTRRYEIALMRERKNVLASITNHKAIMASLRRQDLDGACAALRKNLQIGHDPIAAWLKARESKQAV